MRRIAILAFFVLSTAAVGQTPTELYKCVRGKEIVYQSEPCPAAYRTDKVFSRPPLYESRIAAPIAGMPRRVVIVSGSRSEPSESPASRNGNFVSRSLGHAGIVPIDPATACMASFRFGDKNYIISHNAYYVKYRQLCKTYMTAARSADSAPFRE